MSEYIIKTADWAIDYKGESLFKDCEEIVRCRDCVFHNNHYGDECERVYDDFDVNPDGFCAWGKRKEVGE